MNTTFLLMAQFGSVTLTMDQVRELLGGKAVQTIRNRVAAGKFPRPTSDGVWLVQDVAEWVNSELSNAEGEPVDRLSKIFADLNLLVESAVSKAVPCDKPVVYLLLNGESKIVYVGMSRSHISRMYRHLRSKEKSFDRVAMISCDSIEQAARLEKKLILLLRPIYNVMGVPEHGSDAEE